MINKILDSFGIKESWRTWTLVVWSLSLVHVLIDKVMNPGYYSTQWNGRNSQGQIVGAGVYLYQIQAGEYISTKKMILLK